MCVPFRQYSPTWFILPHQIAVRSELPSGQLLHVVRRVAGEVTPDAPILETTSFESIIGGPLARPRFNTLLLFGFASIALVLSTVGLYTLVASLVQQRTHEIGVRMALGAQRRDIGRLVVGHGLTLAAAGIGAGMLGTLASTRLLRGLLYEVAPADAWTLAGVAPLLLATAALACYVPMRRATRVNPVEVLRAE